MKLITLLILSSVTLLTSQQYSSTSYQPQETQWQKQQRLYIQDPYCLRWNGQICAQCSLRYFTQNQRCTPVNPLCNDFNPNTGDCLSCHPGYQVYNGICSVSQIPVLPVNTLNQWNQGNTNSQWQSTQVGISSGAGNQFNSNPGCASFDGNGRCLRCSDRQYNDSGTGICKQVSDFCRTWDQWNGNCLTCYGGFQLVNGGCFGNYNPGQLLTVRVEADKRSDQSAIVPLGTTTNPGEAYPPIYTQPNSGQTYETTTTSSYNLLPQNQSQNQNQYQNQYQNEYQPQSSIPAINPSAPTQPPDFSNTNNINAYLQQISQLQPLPTN